MNDNVILTDEQRSFAFSLRTLFLLIGFLAIFYPLLLITH